MAAFRTPSLLGLCVVLAGAGSLAGQPAARTDRYGDPLPPGAIARLGTIRWRVHDRVLALAYAPDGKTVISVGSEVVRVFDAATGKPLRTLAHSSRREMPYAAISPDGTTVAVTLDQRKIVLLDTHTGRKQLTLDAKDVLTCPASLAFSPDGKVLVARDDKTTTVALWDVAKGGRLIHRWGYPHPGESLFGPGYIRGAQLAYSADGRRIAAADEWGGVCVREARTGQVVLQKKGMPDDAFSVVSVAVHSTTLAWGLGTNIRWWDLLTGKELHNVDCGEWGVESIAFSPDGRLLASGDYYGPVRFWNVATGREVGRGAVSLQGAWCPTFSPDGSTVAISSGSRIYLFGSPSGKRTSPDAGPSFAVLQVVMSSDKGLLAAEEVSGVGRVWDVRTARERLAFHQFNPKVIAPALAFSPDGRILARGAGNPIRLYRTTDGELIRQLPGPGDTIRSLQFSPDGKYLLARISSWGMDTVAARDVATGETVPYARVSRQVLLGRERVFPSGGHPEMRIHDVEAGKVVARIKLPHHWDVSRAFTPDGSAVAVAVYRPSAGDVKGLFNLWEVTTGKARRQFADVPEAITDLICSPDGRLLATRGKDGTVRLWDLNAGKQAHRLPPEHGSAASLAFSSDGKLLVTGMRDSTVLLWSVAALVPPPETPPAAKLPPQRLRTLWAQLAGSDAAQAFDAILALAADPAGSVEFLKVHLRPALKEFDPLEPAADRHRTLRALEALERAGTAEARRVLERMASGAPAARITRVARGALERLAQRSARPSAPEPAP